jgi:hypothetical protein
MLLSVISSQLPYVEACLQKRHKYRKRFVAGRFKLL